MKKIVKFLLGLCLAYQVSGQEQTLPIINQYIADNPFLLSAAYAGIGDCWQARFTGFEQWVGLSDAPSTQSLSIDGRIANRTGIGAVIFNDSNGFTEQKGIQLSFAHHVTLSEYRRQYLSFGISYKLQQFTIDSSEFNRTLTNGPVGDIQRTDNNFDISILYRHHSFFVSANAINLLNKDILEFNSLEPAQIQNYYVYTGFTFDNLIKEIQYEPSILYRRFEGDERSTLDVNFKLRKFYRDSYFWAGISMRGLIDQSFKPVSVAPLAGIKRQKFYFAYGYQINTNESLALTAGGSHLITIGIDFACKKSSCGCTF